MVGRRSCPIGPAVAICSASGAASSIRRAISRQVVARRYCLARKMSFTTSYMTHFPEYVSARMPVPLSWSYAVLRRFHAAAAVTMVSASSLLEGPRLSRIRPPGDVDARVDTDLSRPERAGAADLPHPIFVSAGRLAVEKNLMAFLALDLPAQRPSSATGRRRESCSAGFRNELSRHRLTRCWAAQPLR